MEKKEYIIPLKDGKERGFSYDLDRNNTIQQIVELDFLEED